MVYEGLARKRVPEMALNECRTRMFDQRKYFQTPKILDDDARWESQQRISKLLDMLAQSAEITLQNFAGQVLVVGPGEGVDVAVLQELGIGLSQISLSDPNKKLEEIHQELFPGWLPQFFHGNIDHVLDVNYEVEQAFNLVIGIDIPMEAIIPLIQALADGHPLLTEQAILLLVSVHLILSPDEPGWPELSYLEEYLKQQQLALKVKTTPGADYIAEHMFVTAQRNLHVIRK